MSARKVTVYMDAKKTYFLNLADNDIKRLFDKEFLSDVEQINYLWRSEGRTSELTYKVIPVIPESPVLESSKLIQEIRKQCPYVEIKDIKIE